MSRSEKTQSILLEMISLFYVGGKLDWVRSFERYHSEVDIDLNDVARKILGLYGGMGSLNDIVIYQNGKVSIHESIKFDLLRVQLFELCLNALSGEAP